MAYDQTLADRVRATVGAHGPTEEKRMFGGLGFLLDGRLAVCVSHRGGLLLEVGEAEQPRLCGEHVTPMVMGSRESRSWVHVAPEALDADAALAQWVDRGAASARARAR